MKLNTAYGRALKFILIALWTIFASKAFAYECPPKRPVIIKFDAGENKGKFKCFKSGEFQKNVDELLDQGISGFTVYKEYPDQHGDFQERKSAADKLLKSARSPTEKQEAYDKYQELLNMTLDPPLLAEISSKLKKLEKAGVNQEAPSGSSGTGAEVGVCDDDSNVSYGSDSALQSYCMAELQQDCLELKNQFGECGQGDIDTFVAYDARGVSFDSAYRQVTKYIKQNYDGNERNAEKIRKGEVSGANGRFERSMASPPLAHYKRTYNCVAGLLELQMKQIYDRGGKKGKKLCSPNKK